MNIEKKKTMYFYLYSTISIDDLLETEISFLRVTLNSLCGHVLLPCR